MYSRSVLNPVCTIPKGKKKSYEQLKSTRMAAGLVPHGWHWSLGGFNCFWVHTIRSQGIPISHSSGKERHFSFLFCRWLSGKLCNAVAALFFSLLAECWVLYWRQPISYQSWTSCSGVHLFSCVQGFSSLVSEACHSHYRCFFVCSLHTLLRAVGPSLAFLC